MAIAKRGSVCRTSRKSTDSSESISTEQEPVPVELNDLLLILACSLAYFTATAFLAT